MSKISMIFLLILECIMTLAYLWEPSCCCRLKENVEILKRSRLRCLFPAGFTCAFEVQHFFGSSVNFRIFGGWRARYCPSLSSADSPSVRFWIFRGWRARYCPSLSSADSPSVRFQCYYSQTSSYIRDQNHTKRPNALAVAVWEESYLQTQNNNQTSPYLSPSVSFC